MNIEEYNLKTSLINSMTMLNHILRTTILRLQTDNIELTNRLNILNLTKPFPYFPVECNVLAIKVYEDVIGIDQDTLLSALQLQKNELHHDTEELEKANSELRDKLIHPATKDQLEKQKEYLKNLSKSLLHNLGDMQPAVKLTEIN